MDSSDRDPITPGTLEGYAKCDISKEADFSEAMKWCADHCGDEFTTNSKTFWFDDEGHAVMFKLTWG